MEFVDLTLSPGKNVSVNKRVICYYYSDTREGVEKTIIVFMGGSELTVTNTYEEVKQVLAG